MHDILRIRRTGVSAVRLLLDLLPVELDRGPSDAEEEVCLVFADVADYSDFVARAGDDAAVAVVEILDDLVRAGLADADARVVKRLGDGLMIVARDPAVALDLAVALVDGFRARTASCGWPLELRAGVHRGTCRRRDGDYFGYHVNLAARVAERAAAGDTLVTANALAGVDLSALGLRGSGTGTLQAKGVTRPVTLFSIVRHPDEAASDERRRPVRIPMLWRLPRIPRGGERSADAV